MRRVCIVIGLQEDLDEVQREADEVAAAAKASGLFHEVHELIAREATVTTFRATIQQAVADLTNNSKLVIFYAGHGSLHDGFTWVKVGEDRIPLETEVLSQTSSYRALDVGFIFSCCQDDLKDPKSDRDTLPDLRQIAEDATVIKMYACPEGCKVVDSFLLGFAFAYHLRKKPRDLNSLLRFVRDDVLQLSMGHIEPHLDDGSSNPGLGTPSMFMIRNPILVVFEPVFFKCAQSKHGQKVVAVMRGVLHFCGCSMQNQQFIHIFPV